MKYKIRLGIPDFESYFNNLVDLAQKKKINKDDARLLKQILKVMGFLSENPKHNSLNSHEIKELSERYSKLFGRKCKVWQSYLENNTPSAGRIYWIYGPGKEDITIIGLEPHPEDKKSSGYDKVSLSNLPPL